MVAEIGVRDRRCKGDIRALEQLLTALLGLQKAVDKS